MSLFNSYDRTCQLCELLIPYDIGSGQVSAATQQATARKNLGIGTGGALATGNIDSTGHILSSSPSGGVGYEAGAGGAVTQLTSRTTGVTLNTVTGAITLFAAAGSATPASFVVTDSAVAATDTIQMSVKSGTNSYLAYVSQVAAGSFTVTFSATVGTASDSPVFNFAVVKGAAS